MFSRFFSKTAAWMNGLLCPLLRQLSTTALIQEPEKLPLKA